MTAAPSRVGERLPLLSTMSRDLAKRGQLRSSTATAMWAGYAAHTFATAWALHRRSMPLHVTGLPARLVGVGLIGAGGALCASGMSVFTSPRELTGTSNQALTTKGIYRYSRNPQYLGYVLVLTGAALARRSGTALASAAALAAAYAAWVPVEEAHLARLHGEPYERYLRGIHRWWGRDSG